MVERSMSATAGGSTCACGLDSSWIGHGPDDIKSTSRRYEHAGRRWIASFKEKTNNEVVLTAISIAKLTLGCLLWAHLMSW